VSTKDKTIVVRNPEDLIIKAVKGGKVLTNSLNLKKTRLYLDVDGTLVAMEFDPTYIESKRGWGSVYRTDFCH
jgi:hypothetical protein